VLAGPFFTLRTGSRSRRLSAHVRSELGVVASLLKGVKTMTCKAFTNKGKHDVAVTRAQARAACTRLRRDGVKARYTSAGMGHSRPSTQTTIDPSRRLLVIRFSF
jgi:hypothetical protein